MHFLITPTRGLVGAYQTNIDKNTIHYSFDPEDSRFAMDIPFELDVIESIIGNDSYSNYIYSINELREILKVKQVTRESILLKIIYSNIITNLETYLFDLAINLVNSDKNSLRKVVENYGLFNNTKVAKNDIFTEYEAIKDSVISELQKKSFHNLSTVVPLFKKGFNIDFSKKINGLYRAVEIRHDIVHRNGMDFKGNTHNISTSDIKTLILKTNELVDYVNREFEKLEIKISSK